MTFLRSRWAFPLACGLAAVAFVALADCVILPLHARGVGQPVTAWVGGLARLVELPGLPGGREARHAVPPPHRGKRLGRHARRHRAGVLHRGGGPETLVGPMEGENAWSEPRP